MILLICVMLLVIPLFSLLFYFAGHLSFVLVRVTEVLLILFIFSKNIVSLTFPIVFFQSVSLISALFFIISFFLLTLDFVISILHIFFKYKVRFFI